MKVGTDQLEALRRQQEQNKVKPKTTEADSFGDLLSQEVDKTGQAAAQQTTGTQPPPPGARAMGVGQVVATEATAATTDAAEIGPEDIQVMERIGTVLDKLDGYAESLRKSGDAGLKQAYGQLETISGDVEQIRKDMPNLGENPELDGMVNELEIMAVTETYKFNRGDYF